MRNYICLASKNKSIMKKVNTLKWAACSFVLFGSMTAAVAQQNTENKATVEKQKIILVDQDQETITLEGFNFQVRGLDLQPTQIQELSTELNKVELSKDIDIKVDLKDFDLNKNEGKDVLMYAKTAETTEKPFLGVGIKTIEAGVKLTEVYENSAAEAAKLLAGDIITAIDGNTINSVEDLQKAIRKHQVGDQMQVSYIRNAQTARTTATLNSRKSRDFVVERRRMHKAKAPKAPLARKAPHNRYYNYAYVDQHKDNFDACEELEKLKGDPFIGVYINMDNEKNGADITGILKDSDAPNSDLQRGDQIVKVNRFKVSDYESLQVALENFEPGDRVRIKYARNGVTSKTPVTLTSRAERHPYKVMKLEKMCAEQQPVDEILTKDNKEESTLPTIKGPALSVFPNPAVDIVNIQFDGGAKAETTILVLDIQGKEVMRKQVNENPEQFNTQLNLSELASGVYVISVQQGDQITSKQISLK